MEVNEYGLCFTDSFTRVFSDNLSAQVEAIWKKMWLSSHISGRKNFTVSLHGRNVIIGYVSFDLPTKVVNVEITYSQKSLTEHAVYSGDKVKLFGLEEEFTIVSFISEDRDAKYVSTEK